MIRYDTQYTHYTTGHDTMQYDTTWQDTMRFDTCDCAPEPGSCCEEDRVWRRGSSAAPPADASSGTRRLSLPAGHGGEHGVCLQGGPRIWAHPHMNANVAFARAGFRYRRGDADGALVPAVQKAAGWRQCGLQILWVTAASSGDWSSKVSFKRESASRVSVSVYKKDLEKELRSETSGDFCKLLVALLHVIISP